MGVCKSALLCAVISVLALAGCAGAPGERPRETFRVVDGVDVGAGPGGGDSGAARLARLSAALDGPEFRVDAAQAPFLTRSPIGRRFLAAPAPRALAIGDPAETCPAAAVAAGPAGASRQAVAARALDACLANLEDAGRDPACGCRVVAVDDVLLAPPSAFVYAEGVGGRLVGDGRFGGRPLIAEEVDAPDGRSVRIAFFDAAGPVAVGDLADDGRARLVMLDDGAVFTGRREPRGWRRGRVQERLLLQGADGARLIALIGFEPADVAAEGPALAVWPRG